MKTDVYSLKWLSTKAASTRPTLSQRTFSKGFRAAALPLLTALLLITSGKFCHAGAVTLSISNVADAVEVSWNSSSVTVQPPFLHYEFQVEASTNLSQWANFGSIIPGGALGSATVPHSIRVGRTNTAFFARLTYRLKMSGADLSGLDFTGADLRSADLSNADLSGANLTGANLSGANLSGVTLTGALLAGANLDGVNLNGLDLAGLDLSSTLGSPLLSQVTANPAGSAAQLVPRLAYNTGASDLVANDPNVPGIVSTRNAMLMLKTNATVGQLNALLETHGASIVASSPGDATLPNGVLMARFPTTSAQALYDLTVALSGDPIVEAAAPDVLLGQAVVPDDTSAATGWSWDINGLASGGNWGLEKARVPQMWNVLGALQLKHAARVPTCIIDVYFDPSHVDLQFGYLLGSPPLELSDHGNHVAGIIGATYDNDLGIAGVNPLSYLIGYTFRTSPGDYPIPFLPGGLFGAGIQANAYSMIQDVRDALRRAPETQIINMSLGYNWYLQTNANRPLITDPFPLVQRGFIEFTAQKYGVLMAGVAASASSVLIVCAAGNDFDLIPARLASPMCTAALTYGSANVLVVESHDIAGAPSAFSNRGGHVAGPGENILSAQGSNSATYATYSGTSMAAPFVTGVAGFLKAVEPSLTPAQLIALIRKEQPNVDAFTSLMEIDRLPGHDRKVLRMLLDIDDSSADGSRRVLVPNAALGRDRSFNTVTGPDFNDDNDHIGDGVIDMSDFRRWRDWLLHSEGGHELNGSATHLKNDGNGNGTPHPHDDQFFYPRGDFNGDAVLDQLSEHGVPGYFLHLPFSDLEVLMLSDLWEDPCFTNEFQLSSLIDSVDITVSAENFYRKHSDIDQGAKVQAYDAATFQPVPGGGVCLDPDAPVHVLTLPTGAKYYVASEPISIGNGTNVQMRSIGDRQFQKAQRGADFATDLTLWEMTVVADTLNPALRSIQSEPNTNKADAYLGTDTDSATETTGARARANDAATMYAIARAGGLPQPPTNTAENTTFASAVRWERSFIKDEDLPNPTFQLKPMILILRGSGPGTKELSAFAEVVVEMRSYDVSPAWQPVFLYHAEIAGRMNDGFRIVGQEGDLPPKTLQLDGTFGAEYRQIRHKDEINLDGIPNGNSFELRFRLNTRVLGVSGDNDALAQLGDPLVYGSGLRMEYGEFGELPRIKKVSTSAPANNLGFQAAAQSPAQIEYRSLTNFYYRLYQGGDADTAGLPIAMKLGIGGDDSMLDPAPLLVNPTPDDYTLENQPIDQPLDFDGDGIDDVYELLRPAILNPLSAADSFLDPDGDGRSNLREYLDGTDPQTPDSPTPNPTLNFPGLLVPTYPGGELIDLNNDGLLDAAGEDLTVALAHLGGTFDTPIVSPTTEIRVAADTAYLRLDGDAFPDAVVIDSLTNRVFTYRGVGDGTFTALTNYPGLNNPSLIALCNLNGDALADLAVFSENGRGVDLHLNNGDGTLTRTATVTTNAYGSGNSFAMADLNNDSRDDIIVGYAFNAVVFLTQPNGTYGPAQPYPVGSFPEAIAAGDLNHDGRPDLVVANSGSDDVSVLVASAPGVFSPHVRYPVGDNPRGLRLADLNGDTHLDAIVSMPSADYQIILPGLGNGAFGPLYTVPAGSSLADIRDWNGDGKLDLISTVGALGGLINFGNGDGTFDTRLQIVPTNPPPTEVTAVDFNGDGKLELVGLQTQINSIDVWEHAAVDGTNRLLAHFIVGPYVQAFTHGDFNRDGLMDLAVATGTNSGPVRGSNQVVVLTNQGNFTFVDAGHYPLAFKPDRIVSADFNGDTHADLTVLTHGGTLNGGARLVALPGDGSGGFQARPPVEVATTIAILEMGDVNGDGHTELVLAGLRLDGTVLSSFTELYGLDDANWSSRQSLVFSNNVGSLKIQSLNGDTYADMVTTEIDGASGVTTLGQYPGGPTGLGTRQVLAAGVAFQSFSHIADLNNDGLLDTVGGYTLYLAKPEGGFHPPQTIWIGAAGIQDVADFNRDGKPDLLNGLSVLLQK